MISFPLYLSYNIAVLIESPKRSISIKPCKVNTNSFRRSNGENTEANNKQKNKILFNYFFFI